MRSRDQPGLRFGLSRHSSVVTSVPVPSPSIAPPSRTISARSHHWPRWLDTRAALDHHLRAPPRPAEVGPHPPGDGRVDVPRRELAAPGVEAEMDDGDVVA